jgi:hypothetical protein
LGNTPLRRLLRFLVFLNPPCPGREAASIVSTG